MENLDFSKIERSKVHTRVTNFDVFPEDDTYSEVEEDNTYESIEIDYAEKLRTQRERMEKLEKCYNEKEQQLGKEVDRTNELLLEIERMASYVPYKEKYDELRQDFSELLNKYNIQQGELEDVKQELTQVIRQNSNTVTRLKSEMKNWKETTHYNTSQLEETLHIKQEQIRQLKRDIKDRECELADQIKSLKACITRMKQERQGDALGLDKQKEKIISELKSRELIIIDLEKGLENARKANSDLKNDLLKYSEEVTIREKEISSSCTKYKQQVTQLKKTISEKDAKIEALQAQVKKSTTTVTEIRDSFESQKAEYNKTCSHYENTIKKMKYESESEINRLETFVQELKDSIQELMEVKNHLLGENRRLVAILKKKEQTERQRKQLLMTEFKEIDRIEKVIDRLE